MGMGMEGAVGCAYVSHEVWMKEDNREVNDNNEGGGGVVLWECSVGAGSVRED